MTASSTLSGFHQWLLSEAPALHCARAVVIHGEPGEALEIIVSEVAEYLNEYDDACEGRWLAATSELVGRIATDTANQRLLGLKVGVDEVPADSTAVQRDVWDAISSRGHVVLAAPATTAPAAETAEAFHVGVGCSADLVGRCHMTLNPARIEPSCIAHIVGDVFLEWRDCSVRAFPGGRPAEENLRGI